MIFRVFFFYIYNKNILIELPDDADDLIEKAWNGCAPLNKVFVKAFGIEITRKDLLSLSGLEWLNDEIINSYMNLIVERARQNTDLPKVFMKQYIYFFIF